jgi:hypothetical protein
MKASIPTLTPSDPQAATEATCWRLHAVATDAPLLLARILQKFAVPEIELRAVHFESSGLGGEAQAVLAFVARPARARLAAARLQNLVGMRSVDLQPSARLRKFGVSSRKRVGAALR